MTDLLSGEIDVVRTIAQLGPGIDGSALEKNKWKGDMDEQESGNVREIMQDLLLQITGV